MWRWEETDDALAAEAEADLLDAGEVVPCLAAFRGEEALALARLRPAAPHERAQPLVEVLALALPLGADRLALAMGGRAWSLDDPIAPVVDGLGDLRQRVLCVHVVDEAGARTVLWPFALVDGAVRWRSPVRAEGTTGPLPDLLGAAVRAGDELPGGQTELRAQAARCAHLGHELYLAPAGEARLAAG